MPLNQTNPQYDKYKDRWEVLDDCFEGQVKIKEEGYKYLPPLPSMHIDGMQPGEIGYKRYEAYRDRAVYPDDYAEGIKNYLGLLHQKAAVITVPDIMKPMLDKCTAQGENMLALLRRINELQLRHGRLGLLLDLPTDAKPDALPYIAVYVAKTCINWDDGTDELYYSSLNMVVLDESTHVRTGFQWAWKERYRYLILGEVNANEPSNAGHFYKQGLFEGSNVEVDEGKLITPVFRGTPLEEIPFQFINTTDITAEPEPPPLMGLADLTLTIYRGEADYRQSLFMQSQDTLVISDGTNSSDDKIPQRVGAGAVINVNMGGDAKYIGTNSQGIPEQRKALEADKEEARLKAGQFIGTRQSSQESGEAMKTRIASRTANLIRLAYTGAAGLENLLKICARWMGANESEVTVTPNLEFAKALINAQDLVQVMTSRNLGAPISLQSIHDWAADQGLTNMGFEEEMALIEKELKKWPLPQQQTADLNTSQQGKTPPKEPVANKTE